MANRYKLEPVKERVTQGEGVRSGRVPTVSLSYLHRARYISPLTPHPFLK